MKCNTSFLFTIQKIYICKKKTNKCKNMTKNNYTNVNKKSLNLHHQNSKKKIAFSFLLKKYLTIFLE